MSAEYHLWMDEQAKGPFTIGQVRAMWNSGRITSENHFTIDAGESWQPLSEMLDALEPTTVSTEDGLTPKGTRKPKVVRWWLIFLLGALVISALGFYLAPAIIRSAQNQNATTTVPAIPVEIKLALNNLSSATGTGITLDVYSNLVIALKTSIATYGQNLSAEETTTLNDIVQNYDNCLQLWKSTENDAIAIPDDSSYLDWLHKLRVDPKEDPTDERMANYESKEKVFVFDLKDLLGKVWNVVDHQTADLLTNN